MKKITARTFGCKVNQYETACIMNDFQKAGFEATTFDESADIFLINTCTVTNRTDYKSRNAIRKALSIKSKKPDVKIIVTGCYSQLNYKAVERLGDVDLIIDNSSKSKILEFLDDRDKNHFQVISEAIVFEEMTTDSMFGKSRAFVKIQDGCDYKCSYCAVTAARGISRSRSRTGIMSQIEKLIRQNYREFVLGGVNLALFGREKEDKYYLPQLLSDLEKMPDVEIIRLSSLEPQLITDELLSILQKSRKIAPHLHLSLQTGNDELLTGMNRKYSSREFSQLITKLQMIKPDIAIGLDVICGFPGETEDRFSQTKKFLKELDFTYLHIFSYSKRPGTRAAKMGNQVNGKIIKNRVNELAGLSAMKTTGFIDKIIGQKTVLRGILEGKKQNYWTALSDHFIRIYLDSPENLKNKFGSFIPLRKKFDGIEVSRQSIR